MMADILGHRSITTTGIYAVGPDLHWPKSLALAGRGAMTAKRYSVPAEAYLELRRSLGFVVCYAA
jgi:hypothetical protein